MPALVNLVAVATAAGAGAGAVASVVPGDGVGFGSRPGGAPVASAPRRRASVDDLRAEARCGDLPGGFLLYVVDYSFVLPGVNCEQGEGSRARSQREGTGSGNP